jgi:DNA-binding Xre family transcriptional regulator
MKWKLKSYLEEHDLTPHQLALESKLSVNTIYPMARGKAERVSLQTLDKVAAALDELTGQRVSVCDLLERE